LSNPLLQLNTLPWTPFNNTKDVPMVRIPLIHFFQFPRNPLCSSTLIITSCSILSNAFSKSIFKITNSFFALYHKCIYSKDQAKQSCIFLFLIKPYWFWCIALKITYWNLFASSLVNNLIELFSKEIGLKSLTLARFQPLGLK
jgi:hypothetical protein